MAALISVFVSLTLQRYDNRGICKKADRVFWCGWWTVGGQVSLQWQESFPQGYNETADRICDWDRTGKSESLGTKLCRGGDKQLWGNEDEERSQIGHGGNNDQVEIHHQSWLLNTQPHNWKQLAGVWGVNAELTHSKLVPDMKVPRATQREKQQPTSPRPWLNVWHSSYHTFLFLYFAEAFLHMGTTACSDCN